MGVTAADFDGDGWPDIYVANDRTENFLFHNKHDGTFEEIAEGCGGGVRTKRRGDIVNGSGLCGHHRERAARSVGERRALQPADEEQRQGGFDDIGIASGLSQANAQYVSWGTGVYDFDNDGLLDIMVFHGGLIQMIPQEHSVFRGLRQRAV